MATRFRTLGLQGVSRQRGLRLPEGRLPSFARLRGEAAFMEPGHMKLK